MRKLVAKLFGTAPGAQRFSDAERTLVRKAIPQSVELNEPLQSLFEDTTKAMASRTRFEGCAGFEVLDDQRLVIAAHASLMLLGTKDYYFKSVRSILVYPNTITRSSDGHTTHAIGEAWDTGNVILSWPAVRNINTRSKQNVVIHEFAHHLDGLDGEMGGSIPFASSADQTRWREVASQEFAQHVAAVNRGKRTLLDPYGANNRAEFFAVTSECFFQAPQPLKDHHPVLFDLLTTFYQTDPLHWNVTPALP